MKYNYKIELDQKSDVWNWYEASKSSSYGYNWRDNLHNEADLKIFDQISKLDRKAANKVLNKYLPEKYQILAKEIEDYKKYLDSEFSTHLQEACKIIEKLTKRKLYLNGFYFLITTFPRCPYNHNNGTIFFNFTSDWSQGGAVKNFLHEVLHFQFHHYWENDLASPVSKLTDEQFGYLKESLTVIIDDDLKPLIPSSDKGYPMHQEYRKILHEYWTKTKDFDKLVEFGLIELPKFLK